MELIEEENPKLLGVLPKEVYGQLVPQEEPELLTRIIKIFKDIPENINIDLFGEIYEFFLGNFALSEGKDGGTFYTPATVVRYMVEVIKPEKGERMFLDPACGSGGMFVQSANFIQAHSGNRIGISCFIRKRGRANCREHRAIRAHGCFAVDRPVGAYSRDASRASGF